jgi:hypothetical protein
MSNNTLSDATLIRDEIVGMALAANSDGEIRRASEALPHVMRAVGDIERRDTRALVAVLIFGKVSHRK